MAKKSTKRSKKKTASSKKEILTPPPFKDLLKSAGLTQKDLAEETLIKPPHLSQIVHGHINNPEPGLLVRIAASLSKATGSKLTVSDVRKSISLQAEKHIKAEQKNMALSGRSRHASAVIFTHLGGLKYDRSLEGGDTRKKALEHYKDCFLTFIRCNENRELIRSVDAYVDWGIRYAHEHGSFNKSAFSVPGEVIAREAVLMEFLKEAARRAREEAVDEGIASDRIPSFNFIGFLALSRLFQILLRIDARLIRYLDRYTYDSPKFVEAVIRIARGATPHLAFDPVVRIDSDVIPNREALQTLLARYEEVVKDRPFFFFSGRYGRTGSTIPEHLNDHAVRLHWFYDEDSRPMNIQINQFLADLDELGATQLEDSGDYYSEVMRERILQRRPASEPTRSSPQLISGAGLIMSLRAIELLPPFANFDQMTVWVDDHIKRRLHEALDDLTHFDIECELSAKFEQDRHPGNRISQGFLDGTKEGYLPRLARGCIFRRLITSSDGVPTEYTQLIRKIVRHRIDRAAALQAKEDLKKTMMAEAMERLTEVLECWSAPIFKGTLSHEWATELLEAGRPAQKRECTKAIDDALEYIDLVCDWPIIVGAIKRLEFAGNDWLFSSN